MYINYNSVFCCTLEIKCCIGTYVGTDVEKRKEVKTIADFSFLSLLPKLPPTIARKSINTVLGGVISSKALANADSRGEGPDVKLKCGKTVFYETESLLKWLDSRSHIQN